MKTNNFSFTSLEDYETELGYVADIFGVNVWRDKLAKGR